MADIDPAPKGRQRCKACGAPRLVLNAGHFQLSGAERTSLLLARRALLRSGLWKALGVGLGALGGFSLLVAAIAVAVTSPGVMLGTLALALASMPALFGLGAYRRGAGAGKEGEEAWKAAELSAVKQLAETAPGELDGAAVAQALGIDESRADLLLAELSLDDQVMRRVTAGGALAYSARPQLRVAHADTEELPALGTPEPEDEALAEEKLLARKREDGS